MSLTSNESSQPTTYDDTCQIAQDIRKSLEPNSYFEATIIEPRRLANELSIRTDVWLQRGAYTAPFSMQEWDDYIQKCYRTATKVALPDGVIFDEDFLTFGALATIRKSDGLDETGRIGFALSWSEKTAKYDLWGTKWGDGVVLLKRSNYSPGPGEHAGSDGIYGGEMLHFGYFMHLRRELLALPLEATRSTRDTLSKVLEVLKRAREQDMSQGRPICDAPSADIYAFNFHQTDPTLPVEPDWCMTISREDAAFRAAAIAARNHSSTNGPLELK